MPAQALGAAEHAIVKTLVMEDEARKPLIVLMHGDRKVSTKNPRARPAANRSSRKPEVAQRHTGYQVGGTSPFGTKKPLPVYVERSILELPEIYINGGRRGCWSAADRGPRARAERQPGRRRSIVTPTNLVFGKDAELGRAHLDPGRAEVVHQQRGDAVGEGLDQAEMPAGGERADAQRDLLVVDGVGHLVALEHRRAGHADVEVDLHGLRHVALAAVDADLGLDAQVAEDDRVHHVRLIL